MFKLLSCFCCVAQWHAQVTGNMHDRVAWTTTVAGCKEWCYLDNYPPSTPDLLPGRMRSPKSLLCVLDEAFSYITHRHGSSCIRAQLLALCTRVQKQGVDGVSILTHTTTLPTHCCLIAMIVGCSRQLCMPRCVEYVGQTSRQ